jgi:hypothetical protein
LGEYDRLAVSEIADYCFIDILEDQSLRRIVLLSPDRNPETSLKEIHAMLTVVAKHVFEVGVPSFVLERPTISTPMRKR